MILLVCGGRTYSNAAKLEHVLTVIHTRRFIVKLIQGGAMGADKLARVWAAQNNVECQTYEAPWNTGGRRAGPIRNQQMLDDGKPDAVVAFPGGVGTADMVRRAKKAGFKVFEVPL